VKRALPSGLSAVRLEAAPALTPFGCAPAPLMASFRCISKRRRKARDVCLLAI
jgi:hypothetical protein